MGDILLNIVDGTATAASADGESPVVDPCTEETYASAPVSGAVDVDRAFQAAERAFGRWSEEPPRKRSGALLDIASALETRFEEFVALESRNTGAPLPFARDEMIAPAVDAFRFFAGCGRMLHGLASAEYLPGHTSSVRREPIGVCAQIATWNYPLSMAAWQIAPALAAGNTVVFKPARTTPVTALRLAELAQEFLPPGTLNVVCGDRHTSEALVTHGTPRLLAMSGSTAVGRHAARAAVVDFKLLLLGLGGKSAAIVFDDVEVSHTADQIVRAAYFNAGQDCTAASRVLVHDAIAAKLANELALRSEQIVSGPPSLPSADYGPLNSRAQLDRVTELLDRVPGHADVLLRGGRHGDRGFFVAPTVVAGLEQHDELVQEEIFGPVITVQSFTTEAEAIELANGVPYGLAASIWTNDHGRCVRVSRALDCGCVWINAHTPIATEMPHGGFKHSGYGKELSLYGFESYTRIKHVMASSS